MRGAAGREPRSGVALFHFYSLILLSSPFFVFFFIYFSFISLYYIISSAPAKERPMADYETRMRDESTKTMPDAWW